ncbi:A disintegrin and metalloproteinase with thrombospondin motifs 12-like [Hetaerina americana]|uniref:A disintegrin and metalloproteinase with thrombospondin motifs 12-like n=1 Tax=Hetaerina americana TaxID=62018 RepID=UPI003A7F1B5E
MKGRYTRDIKEYEIVVPQKVNEDSSFLSYILPHYHEKVHKEQSTTKQNGHSARKRSDKEHKVHYKVRIGGRENHLELLPNWNFISPNLILEVRGRRESGNTNKVKIRQIGAEHNCHYNGLVRGQPNSFAALSLCDGLVGYIKTNENSYFIEPLKGEEPAANGEHLHVIFKRRTGHPGSETGTCGTSGFCVIMTEEVLPLLLLSMTHGQLKKLALSDDWEGAWKERLTREALHHRESRNSSGTYKRSTSGQNFIETLVVADKKFIEYHKGSNIERYILTVMNMVSGFYHDSSIGNQIDVIIVRIMLMETEKEEMDLSISKDSENTLKSFCKWQQGMNPKISHPNHHDIAVLLTRHDLCAEGNDEGACGLLGLAYLTSVCLPEKSCCINEDNGLVLGITVTHEIGHLMGCSHDDPAVSGCSPQSGKGFSHVMAPYVGMSVDKWSKCSRKYVTELLDNNLGSCLENEPEDHKFELDEDMPPGAVYDADFQCSLTHGPNTKSCIVDSISLVNECSLVTKRFLQLNQQYDSAYDYLEIFSAASSVYKEFCKALFCTGNGTCYSFGEPPADGTSCGAKKWCYQKKCVEVGSRPDAINGGWGAWSPHGECSRTCGGGVAMSERECDNPRPNRKGRYCFGQRKRYSICNTNKCPPNKPNFRELQCSEKNSVEYNGELHTWKPYFIEENPCALVCLHEGNLFLKMGHAVKDGTPCKPGTRDMCIGGVCRTVGCDWGLDSDAIEDACGVCNGDGTHCKLVEGTFTQLKGNGYVEISTIPMHSRNILIEELEETENTLAIGADDHMTFYLNGNYQEESDGEYSFGRDTIGIYSHPEPQKDKLVIRGPSMEDLILYNVFYGHDNPGIYYQYYVPIGGTGRIPSYHWEFVNWEPCSVMCGGGTRISAAKCIEEESGEVSDTFCTHLPKPETKMEECNTNPCPTRWSTGSWSKCTGCDGKKGFQTREVQCMTVIGNGEEEEIADSRQCTGKPPNDKQTCTGDEPCQEPRDKKNSKPDTHVGEIAKDPIPKEQITLIKIPIIHSRQDLKLSDEAYDELGDQLPDEIDKKKTEIFKGKDAINEEGRIMKESKSGWH